MINVTNELELRNALTSLESEIIIENDITITSALTINYTTSFTGGADGVSMFWTNPRASAPDMIIINSNGSLTIENLIFDAENRDGTFVQINGGTFTMNENTILRNISGRTSQNAVSVGGISSSSGGTFNMNYGLITGINSSDAVINFNGKVFLNNDAKIDNNQAAGVTMSTSTVSDVRPSLVMSGTSTISNNESSQGASAGIILEGDIIMGVNPGDSPSVENNRTSVYSTGGWYLSTGTTLEMHYNSRIANNYAIQYSGGLAIAYGSTLLMYDNSSISNNSTDGFAGGIAVSGSRVVLNDNSEISSNSSVTAGGGIYLVGGSTLEMNENATIDGNRAQAGAGIFISSNETTISSATIGSGNSSPRITNNIASENGGGIYLSQYSIVNLLGNTLIENNNAVNGKGIYKLGTLNLSESPRILDGLFFNNTEPEIPVPSYTENVPTIVAPLTEDAIIQLEASDYVNPLLVPLVIADKGDSYSELADLDRQAWKIPDNFGSEYQVILNETLNQVLIVKKEIYEISYNNLQGTKHTNPLEYSEEDLPINLTAPSTRTGYRFIGWQNSSGEIINVIELGTTGDISLTAVWEATKYTITYLNLKESPHTNPLEYIYEDLPITLTPANNITGYRFVGWQNEYGEIITSLPIGTVGNVTLTAIWEEIYLIFDSNYLGKVCFMPKNIKVETESIIIPCVIPYTCCCHYCFNGWINEDSDEVFYPGDTVNIQDKSITLKAIWVPSKRC